LHPWPNIQVITTTSIIRIKFPIDPFYETVHFIRFQATWIKIWPRRKDSAVPVIDAKSPFSRKIDPPLPGEVATIFAKDLF
jgi:hypothetical protein